MYWCGVHEKFLSYCFLEVPISNRIRFYMLIFDSNNAYYSVKSTVSRLVDIKYCNYDNSLYVIDDKTNSTSFSSMQTLHASPRPTASGAGTVPDLIFLSCPPPDCMGSTLTRGLLHTYKAPIPTT